MKALIDSLNHSNIPYVIVGGIEVIVHGRPRATTDIDVIIDHRNINRKKFVDALIINGFDVSLNDLNGLDEKLHVSFFYKKSMFRIDLKGVYKEKDIGSIKEATVEKYNQLELRIDDPQNIIANKLIFGSQTDIEDAIAVLSKNIKSIN